MVERDPPLIRPLFDVGLAPHGTVSG